MKETFVLSIAGFDPSGGAGVIADCKTIHACGCYALAACTALTFQNESKVFGVNWVSLECLQNQLDPLFLGYQISAIKIGIIPNFTFLAALLDYLENKVPNVPIVWDPVLMATAGFSFIEQLNYADFKSCLQRVSLCTPNLAEAQTITGKTTPNEVLAVLKKIGPVYIKGYDVSEESFCNVLVTKSLIKEIRVKRLTAADKHGSGCVLSSAIAVGLAQKCDLLTAVEQAEKYIQKFLTSTATLLGNHGELRWANP